MKANPPVQERIVQVAEEIFLRRGFRQVSMDELAAELGMSKKTLYLHFSSKEELLRAVLRRRVEGGEEGLKEIVEGPGKFPEKMQRLAHFAHGKVSPISAIFLDDIRRHAPQCFEIVEEFRARAIPKYFGAILDEGIAEGYVRADLHRELLIRMLVLSVQGIVRPGVVEQYHLLPVEALDAIISILLRGALTAEGRRLKAFSP